MSVSVHQPRPRVPLTGEISSGYGRSNFVCQRHDPRRTSDRVRLSAGAVERRGEGIARVDSRACPGRWALYPALQDGRGLVRLTAFFGEFAGLGTVNPPKNGPKPRARNVPIRRVVARSGGVVIGEWN
jgi:hypothetical protein